MATRRTHKTGGIGKDVAVYVCLLVLARDPGLSSPNQDITTSADVSSAC